MLTTSYHPASHPPVVVKYPIEDLEIHPRPHFQSRPQLKYFPEHYTTQYSTLAKEWGQIDQKSLCSVLEIWNTLNVHAEFFVLDTFTFDDFIDALLFDVEDVDCELLSEIHCALLKTLVDQAGNPDASLPNPSDDLEDEDMEDDSHNGSVDNSATSTPAPQVSPRQSGRVKRGSLLKNDISKNLTTQTNGHATNGTAAHRADEMLGDKTWSARVKAKDFQAGGWQTVVVGLLQYLTLAFKHKDDLQTILSHLAPNNMKPTRETVVRQYTSLSVNHRISVLEMLVMLAATTKTLKDAMEERIGGMTDIRKEKVNLQRDKKIVVEDIHELHGQRRELELQIPGMDVDTTMNGISLLEKSELKDEDDSGNDTEEEGPRRGRRVNDLKRKREIEEEVRKEKEKQAKLDGSINSQHKRIMREISKKEKDIIDGEQRLIDLEEQLRMHACHRTKVLGRDRFWNRYYWFERNGMPLAGSETSSTAGNGYANGRIWVQGPDVLERAGFIDLPPEEIQQYSLAFGMSVQERQNIEHGPTQLQSAWDWAYYDTPEDLDQLIGWLDERGNREKALRKELTTWRDKIAEHMTAMNSHLTQADANKAAADGPVVGIATRTKTYVEHNATKHPCLAWTNSLAKHQLGQLHSEGQIDTKAQMRGKARPVVPEKRETRSGRLR